MGAQSGIWVHLTNLTKVSKESPVIYDLNKPLSLKLSYINVSNSTVIEAPKISTTETYSLNKPPNK